MVTNIFDTAQKKALEKFYARIFDTNKKLTEDGKTLCSQANVDPQEIVTKGIEDFLEEASSQSPSKRSPLGIREINAEFRNKERQEVAKVRF